MGLFGGSSSKSSATASETGQQVEDEALALSIAGSKFKNSTVNVQSTDFGAVDGSFDLADKSLALAGDSTRNALEFGAGAFQSAIASADASRSQALEFGAGAFQSAIDSVNAASARSSAVQSDALKKSREAGREALEFGAGAFQSALAAVDSAADEAVSTASAAFNSAQGQVSQFAETAIDKVSEASRSEASAGFQLLIKIVGGVAVAGLAVYILRGRA